MNRYHRETGQIILDCFVSCCLARLNWHICYFYLILRLFCLELVCNQIDLGFMLYIRIDYFQHILIKIMIARAQIGKFLGFPWLRLCSPYSSEKMKSPFSYNAQMAVWASTIVKKICSSNGSDQITYPSLRELLLNLQHPADVINNLAKKQKILNNHLIFDDDILIEILKIFKDGAFLSKAAFNQQRIRGSKQPRRFIFCPNYLVTQPMFQKLRWEQSNMLIYGGFGIGKTAALILFMYLSSIINTFIYQSPSQKYELNFLKNLNLIIVVPKLFYWSLDLHDDQSKLKSLIIAQATQLSQKQTNQLLMIVNFSEFIESLKKKYDDKGIKVRTVIDQINFFAAIFRKWNYFCMTNPVGSIGQVNEKQKQNTKMKEGKILLSHIKQIMKNSNSTFFNSSANIQDELLEPQIDASITTLDVQNFHVKLNKFRVPYLEKLRTTKGCNDFTHVFWFSIKKILKRSDFGQEQLNKLKSIFYQQLKNKKWPIYVRFLNISNMLKKDFNVFFGQNLQTKFLEANFIQTTNELVQRLKAFSIEQYQQNLKKFIKKKGESEQTQREKLYFLNVILKMAEQSDQTSEQCLQIEFNRLESKLFYDIKSNDKVSLPFVHKQLFQTEYQRWLIKIKFLFTAKEFIEITKDIINQETMDYFRIDPELVSDFLKMYKSSQRSLMEFALIHILRRVGTQFEFEIRRPKDLPLKLQFKTMLSTQFFQMNKSSDNSISSHFGSALKLAEQNPNQYIFATPIRIEIIGDEVYLPHSETSKCFDFVFIILNTQTIPVFQIYTFDATITTQLYTKIKDAKDLLPKMTIFPSIVDKPYKIMHTVFCDKNIKDYFIDDQNRMWQIATCTFESIKLTAADKQSQKILANYLQQLSIYQLVKRNKAWKTISKVKQNKK